MELRFIAVGKRHIKRGDINQPGVRIEGHRVPVVTSVGAWLVKCFFDVIATHRFECRDLLIWR